MPDSGQRLIWNAHVKQLRLEGERVIAAFEALKFHLAEAQRPNAADMLIGRRHETPVSVEIPLWAINELVECWTKYDGFQDSPTFGQAFGLEGTGKGKPRAMSQVRRWRKYTECAVDVTVLMESGILKTEAIKTVAAKYGIEADALRKALSNPDAA